MNDPRDDKREQETNEEPELGAETLKDLAPPPEDEEAVRGGAASRQTCCMVANATS